MCSLLYHIPFLGTLQHPLQIDVFPMHPASLPHVTSPGCPFLLLAGDVHIAIMDRSGQLEVEVVEARGLTPKPGSKSLPGEPKQLGGLRKDPGRAGV